MDHRPGQGDLATHAERVDANDLIAPLDEVKGEQQLLDSLRGRSCVYPSEFGHELQEFSAGQLFVDDGRLGQITQARLGLRRFPLNVQTTELCVTPAGLHEPYEHLEGRGLARPVHTQHRSHGVHVVYVDGDRYEWNETGPGPRTVP